MDIYTTLINVTLANIEVKNGMEAFREFI